MADYVLKLIVDGDSSGGVSALNSATGALNTFGSNAMKAGGILSAGLTLPLVGIGTAAIAAGTKLNAAMANIGSMGVAIPRVNELKKSIQDLSIATGKSTDDLARGTYQIISAYGDSASTAKILEVNTKIAAAGVATLSDVVKTVAIVTKNWGDTTVEAQQHVGDQLLKTVALGTTTLPELSSSLGGVAPQAHAAGLSTNEMFAIMATGSGVVGSTSQVVTDLASTLAAFQKPGEDMQKVIKGAGFASGEAMIKTLGFNGAILKTKEYSDKTGTSLLTLFKRKEATNLVTALSTTLQKNYNDNLKQYNDIAGETDMAYDAQANGANKAGHALDIMGSTIQVVLQKINDGMGPALLEFASLMQPVALKIMDMVDAFDALNPATQTWIVGIAAGAAAIGPLLLGVGSLARAVSFFLPFAAGMVTALLPITAALGAGYLAYRLNLFGLKDLVDSGFKRVQAAAPLAGDALRGVWREFTSSRENLGKNTLAIYEFVDALTGSDAAGLTAVNWVTGLATKIQALKSAYNEAGGGFAGFTAGLKQITGVDLSKHITFTQTADGSKKHVSVWDFVTFDETKTQKTLSLGKYFSIAENTIKGTVDLQVGTFKTTIDLPALRSNVEKSIGEVGAIIQGIPGQLTKFFTVDANAANVAQDFGFAKPDSPFMAALKGIPEKVQSAFSSLSWSTITFTFTGLVSQIGAKLSAIDWSGVTATFDTLKKHVGDLLGGVDFSTTTTTFDSFTKIIDGLNASLKGLTAGDGGITKLQNLFLGGLKTVTDAIAGVDENKVATVSISFSESVKSVLGIFTTLSKIGGVELTTETKSISDIVKSVLDLSTAFTKGMDATGIASSAGEFVASYVDKLNAVLKTADIPGVAKSASGLLEAITGQFANAMKGTAPTEIGKSLGGLASTMVTQLGAVLNDKALAATLGKSFANIIVGITTGLNNALKGFNSTDATKNIDMQGALAGFITNFLSGVAGGLAKADYGNVVASFVGNLFKSILSGNGILKDIQDINENGAGLKNVTTLIKDLALLGNPFGQVANKMGEKLGGDDKPVSGGGFGGPGDKPITANSVTITTSTANLTGAGSSNWLTGAGGGDKTPTIEKPDFSALLNDLKTFKPVITLEPPKPLKVEAIPDAKVEPIPPIPPPVILPPVIPPVQVSKPTWLGALLTAGANLIFGNNASGTDNWRGGWTWVGENGPELLNLPGSSKIVSNDNSKKMIGHMAGGNYDVPYSPTPYTGPYAPQPFGNNFFGNQAGPSFDVMIGPLNRLTATVAPALSEIAHNTANTNRTLVSTATRAAQTHTVTGKQKSDADIGKLDSKLDRSYIAMQKEGMEFAKGFKGTVAEFKSFLQKVPGLFGASSVTSEDMAAAKAGTYQPKADEKLRQLKDLSEHGVKYAGLNVQDFKDALGRIGIKASDDLKTLTAQVTSAWNDQSLFADKKNISSLIDIKAVKSSITEQKTKADQSAAGNANLMALFGITPEAAKATGKKARQDLQAGFMDTAGVGAGATGTGAAGGGSNIVSSLLGNATVTPESVAPLAQSLMTALGKALTPSKDKNGKSTGVDFGALFATAINDSISTTTALDATGAALLAKITGSFKTVSGVDFIGGIVALLDTNLADKKSIDALNNVGQKIGGILKQGIADFFKTVDVAAAINNGVKPATGSTTTTTTPGNATGTNFWRGGYTRMDERGGEIVDLPRGARVYPHDVSMAMAGAGAGGDVHNHYYTINTAIDYEKAAYEVSRIQQRRGR